LRQRGGKIGGLLAAIAVRLRIKIHFVGAGKLFGART
jgi:hypothetical protein